MFESDTQILLKRVLEELSKKYGLIFDAIRIPFSLMITDRVNKRHSKSDRLITELSNLLFFIRSSIFNKFKVQKNHTIKNKYLFVIDHNREPLINVFLEVIKGLPQEEVCIVTINNSIYKQLRNQIPYKVIYVDRLSYFKLLDFKLAKEVQAKIEKIDLRMPFFDKFSLFLNLLKIISYENLYKNILSNNIRSILTLCDANLHESIVTRIANSKGIETTTLQHGVPNILWFPVISRNFLVWNEHTKQICKERYEVPESKIQVIGNPIFQQKKVHKKEHNLFTITYIVTNWGKKENEKLFKIFIKIASIKNIRLIIKLRPNPPSKMLSLYKAWTESSKAKNVEIIYKEDINSVLAQTDLVVTFHSGVPIEAMAYEVPSVLLDVFEYIDLKKLMGHYEDCLIVNKEEEYVELIKKIVEIPDYYNSLVNDLKTIKPKYFLEKKQSEVIHEVRSVLIN